MTALTLPRSPSSASVRTRSSGEALVCAGVLLLLGVRLYLPSSVPVGLAGVLAMAPVWLRLSGRFHWARTFFVLVVLTIVAGLILNLYAPPGSASRQGLVGDAAAVLLVFFGVGVVLWGRTCFGRRWTALLVGLGMIAGALLRGPDGTLDYWKGGLSTPVAIVVLALTYRRPGWSVAALLSLAGASIVLDARAQAVVFLMSVLVVLTQRRRSVVLRNGPTALVVALLVLLAFLAYRAGTGALLQGFLGEEARQRTLLQVDKAGSVILGGRPEIAATLALMAYRPLGFGFGVAPTAMEVLQAKKGMAAIRYDPNNGYVERYMLGNGFELHSVIGDLWALAGPITFVLLALALLIIVKSVANDLFSQRATGLVLFLVLWTGWNLLFSPFGSSGLALTLALGLTMRQRQPGDQQAGAHE